MPNYFGPAFRVKVNNRELAADVSKCVEQVSIVSKWNEPDSFSITLANDYPEMRWTHDQDDASLFTEGNEIKIELGYVDDMKEMMDGDIYKVGCSFPDSGVPTLTVEGYSRLYKLHGDKKTSSFKQMSDKQIVEKIAGGAQLNPNVDETGETFEHLIQANQTDLEFVKMRAARINFEVLVEEKTLIFRKARENSSPSYTFVWGHPQEALSGGSTCLPLKSFAPELNATQQVKQVTVRAYDRTTKQTFVGTAGIGQEDAKRMGESTGGQAANSKLGGANQSVRIDLPVCSQSEADRIANTLYNEKAMKFVTGTANTIGVPGLKAGLRVVFAGVGLRFNGPYYVSEATHTIGSGGYSTEFNVQRNAVTDAKSN